MFKNVQDTYCITTIYVGRSRHLCDTSHHQKPLRCWCGCGRWYHFRVRAKIAVWSHKFYISIYVPLFMFLHNNVASSSFPRPTMESLSSCLGIQQNPLKMCRQGLDFSSKIGAAQRQRCSVRGGPAAGAAGSGGRLRGCGAAGAAGPGREAASGRLEKMKRSFRLRVLLGGVLAMAADDADDCRWL